MTHLESESESESEEEDDEDDELEAVVFAFFSFFATFSCRSFFSAGSMSSAFKSMPLWRSSPRNIFGGTGGASSSMNPWRKRLCFSCCVRLGLAL
eukprot:CAMPEP_0204409938 /NCGR_PEP_ID=MMETSP0470-20130426/10421_1 /ASSEMBLY_ACC=CAM_ASM_000385 /TAXON_ID=2969 /ORGANISM="Oxyrrhis marina" /LENGTH=94 /DNA_ID=CAMNT_0051405807 /DNA_START=76 /DNA_END=360 /DNA_ORIENTATION=+